MPSPPPSVSQVTRHLELGVAAALVCAAQHGDVGVVAADADLDVPPVQGVPSVASTPTQP